MLRFINKLTGAVARGLILSPFLLAGLSVTPFLFIDRIIQGRFEDGLWEIPRIPLKLLFWLGKIAEIFINGWKTGFTGLFTSRRLSHFVHNQLTTDADTFYALASPVASLSAVNHFEGPVVGWLARKLMLLIEPLEAFEMIESYADNPHHPRHVVGMNEVYGELLRKHQLPNGQERTIYEAINLFLMQQATQAATEDEAGYAQMAQRCLERLKEDYQTGTPFKTEAIDLNEAPKPFYVLCLIWQAIKAELPNADEAMKVKTLLLGHLTQIQRGHNRIATPEDDGSADDAPECPTGAVKLLLDVLAYLPNAAHELTSQLDSIGLMRQLLSAKLQQNYNINVKIWAPLPINLEKFKHDEQRPMRYYANFLGKSSQQGLSGLPMDDVSATAEATIEAWTRRQPLP